jgi:hypothetical protein
MQELLRMPPVGGGVRAWIVVLLGGAAAVAGCVARADGARAAQRLGAFEAAASSIATSASGRSVALAARESFPYSLAVRVAGASGPFGAARVVPGSISRPRRGGPADAHVVVGAGGRALLLWRASDGSLPAPPYSRDVDCCDRLWAAVLDERGRLRPARQLSASAVRWTPVALYSFVGAVRGRRAAVAWRDPLGIRVAVADARGRFGAPVTLAGDGEGDVLAVRLAAAGPRVVVSAAAGAIVELRRVGAGTARRVLGSFPPGTTVGAAATASGNMLLVGQRAEGLYPYVALRLAHRRGGGRLRFANVRVRSGNLQPYAVAIAGDGRGLVMTGSASPRRSDAVVVAVDRRGRPTAARALARSSGWDWREFAVAVSSSGRALVAAMGRIGRRTQRVFAWRVGIDGRGARRSTVLREAAGGYSGGIGTGIGASGSGVVAWARSAGLFAARVPR